jgi:hypothetical protein
MDNNEIAVEFLQQATVSSYETNCTMWTKDGKRKVPWYSPHLEWLQQKTRVSMKAKRTGVPSDWVSYKEEQGRY